MPWYAGPTLLDHLERVEVAYDHPYEIAARFPVQWVVRPGGPAASSNGASGGDVDYRGYAGQLASGALRVGDEVVVLPSGLTTRIAAIDTFDGPLEEAIAPLSVTLRIEDDLDVSRGDLICPAAAIPNVGRELQADVCWMSEEPLRPGARYALKHTPRAATAIVDELRDVVDVHTLERRPPTESLELNDIGRVALRTSAPLAFDGYRSNRRTGSFILIDEASNGTVGAGLIAA
jgi:sulfate adenylyltransferase subunit 1 (EFTu-like GTPase family)